MTPPLPTPLRQPDLAKRTGTHLREQTAPSIRGRRSAVLDPTLAGRFAKEAKPDFTRARSDCELPEIAYVRALGNRASPGWSRPSTGTSTTCRRGGPSAKSNTRICYLSALRSSPPLAPKPGLSFLPRLLPLIRFLHCFPDQQRPLPPSALLRAGGGGPSLAGQSFSILRDRHLREPSAARMFRRPFSLQPRLRLPTMPLTRVA